MNKFHAIVALALASMVASACGPDPVETGKKKDAADAVKEKAEVDLLTDPTRGPAEIDSRLRHYLVIQDGMIMVHNQQTAIGSYTVPIGTSWAVACGAGLTFTVGGAAELYLSFATFTDEACDKLGFVIGKKLQAFTAGG
jgi:hypothetical protein